MFPACPDKYELIPTPKKESGEAQSSSPLPIIPNLTIIAGLLSFFKLNPSRLQLFCRMASLIKSSHLSLPLSVCMVLPERKISSSDDERVSHTTIERYSCVPRGFITRHTLLTGSLLNAWNLAFSSSNEVK